MARYIDADKLVEHIKDLPTWYEDGLGWHSIKYPDGMFDCYDVIESINNRPTADVAEVRHGHWIPSNNGINPIRCSECNMPAPFAAGENEFGDFEICRYPSSYCHECGAKMDGRGEDDA